MLLFFFIFNFPIDTFLNFVSQWQREKEAAAEKAKKIKKEFQEREHKKYSKFFS